MVTIAYLNIKSKRILHREKAPSYIPNINETIIINDDNEVLDLKQIEQDEIKEDPKLTIDELEINKIQDSEPVEEIVEEEFQDELDESEVE